MLHGYFPHAVYKTIYWPLFWLADRWEPLGDLLIEYLLDL